MKKIVLFLFISQISQINYSMNIINNPQATNILCKSITTPIAGIVASRLINSARSNVNYNFVSGQMKVHQIPQLTDQQFHNSIKNVLQDPTLLEDLDQEELNIYKKFALRQENTQDIQKFKNAIKNEEDRRFMLGFKIGCGVIAGVMVLSKIIN